MAKLSTPEVSTKDKIYNLVQELQQAKLEKKETVKTHNENIKRIEGEIKDILDQEEEQIKESQKEVD